VRACANMPVTFDETAGASREHTPTAQGQQAKKRKSSLKSYDSAASAGSSESTPRRGVSFHDEVTVRALPASEAEDAMDTRKGKWEAVRWRAAQSARRLTRLPRNDAGTRA